jgi:large subunit ribosomal protein LP0
MRCITWLQGVARLAALCLSISYPTLASAPHSIINGFKNLLAIAAATDVSFKEAHTIKEFLKVRIALIMFIKTK